ncbi:MAG: FAD-dependent oxidoreductase, partial [bacterium]
MNFTRRDEIVIIGANTAGLSAALAVRRSGDSRPITILERKKYIGVARCSIPYLAGEDALKAEELIRRDPEKFSAENRLQIVTEAEVTGIEPSTRTVFYNHEDIQKDIEYSKLLLASGSVPVCPASFSAAGELLTAYDVEDLVRLNLSLKAGMKLAILGGGPIGIELAYQLARRGYEVTVFEMRNIIPPLSEKTSRQVVDQLAEAGVKVLEQTAVEEVQKISSGFNIRAAGNLHQFDLAIAALGFRPMSDFINDPELQKKEDGSIPVDRRMRSGLPDVYAAGDLVARPAAGRGHIRWPLASSASVDGWVAGMNIAGELEY